MTENPFTDGQQFSAARLNSMYNAHQNEGVLNGCDGSPSANNFDVDISSGQIKVDFDIVDVSGTTVSHSTSDPQDRIDLITADSNGTVSIKQGDPAAVSGQPIAPDIPNNQLLLSLVFVRSNSTEILTGDINDDYRAEIVPNVPPGIIVMFGGAISNIPDGWELCDGSNDTPDLRDRFVIGAGGSHNVDDTGGSESVQLTLDEIPPHNHDVLFDYQDGNVEEAYSAVQQLKVGGLGETDPNSPKYENTNSRGDGYTDDTGGNQSHENIPPFYALAYIQKQ